MRRRTTKKVSVQNGYIGYQFVVPTGPATLEKVTCHAMVGEDPILVLKDGTRLIGKIRHDGMYFFPDMAQKEWKIP